MVRIQTVFLLTSFLSAGFLNSGSTGLADELRLPDDRPLLDRVELEATGLRILESRHLRLVTDAPLAQVEGLPELADALFTELQKELGPVPSDLAGTEFQVTGFLIDAPERFRKAGVLPPESFQIRHGRHLGYQFWMNNQTTAYYRRHLMLHEFIHCFMMCTHGMQDIPPLWYTEGIAEYFATHRLADNIAESRFGILPDSRIGFEGWGGINVIRRTLSEQTTGTTIVPDEQLSLSKLLRPTDLSFTDDLKYAQAWAAVWMFRNHPELGKYSQQLDAVRTYADYVRFEDTVSREEWDRLQIIWPLILDSLVENFDAERSFPSLKSQSAPWAATTSNGVTIAIQSNRDWQSSGFIFRRGDSVRITCSGRYAVHDEPKPWISEPQGVTIDYFDGRPLGEVLAMVIPRNSPGMFRRTPIGTEAVIEFDNDSELWFQINDSAASRKGNSGFVTVKFEAREGASERP